MENKLVKKQSVSPAFIEDSFKSIEKAIEYAELLLSSKMVPDHFYEKGPDNKPDYNKGKPGALVMVLQHGMSLGLNPTQSLQQVVPINGLLTVKGDGCKNLILSSGICSKWEESQAGTMEKGDYTITITAERKDTGEERTETFSIERAKRAGLWITQEKLNKQDGWKYKQSAWYKYPERMIRYRVIGFIARDLFPDILQGSYVFEEIRDNPDENVTTIETKEGKKVEISDAKIEHLKEQSGKVSSSVSKKAGKGKEGKTVKGFNPEEIDKRIDEIASSKSEKSTQEDFKRDISKEKEKVIPEPKEDKKDAQTEDKNIKKKKPDYLDPNYKIPEVEKGKEREFEDMQDIYIWLENQGLDQKTYSEAVTELLQIDKEYKDLEDLCKRGSKTEIEKVLSKFNEFKK